DPTEPPQRVAPEEWRDASGTDALELREVEPAAPNEGDRGRHVDVRGKDLGDLSDPHRRRVEAGGEDLHDVRGQPGPELHRLDPALVTQSVHGLPDPMAGDGPPFAERQAGRRHPGRQL